MTNFDYLELELPSKSKWIVACAKIDFSSSLFHRAIEQTNLKVQHTMNASQAGEKRSNSMKYNKQLMGTFAEIYCQEYLIEILRDHKLNKNWSVIRYDDIRTDNFKSPKNEYDIKIEKIDSSKTFFVEARSSIAYNRGLIEAIRDFDVIGPYESLAKQGEKLNDFYLRPLYSLIDYNSVKYDPILFNILLQQGSIKLYIVAGLTKEIMLRKGYQKDMNQLGTNYRVVKIINADDAKKFHQTFISSLES